MIDTLTSRLAMTRPPADLAGEALAQLPSDVRRRVFAEPLIPAAVLVALSRQPGGWELLLTRRADGLRDHPGQISLPGGCLEPGDAGPRAAALREAREEIGLSADFVSVIGYLRPQAVVTGFAICPVVARLRPGFRLHADPLEVAETFWLPLEFLTTPGRLVCGERIVRGVTLPVLSCQYGPYDIWGATAHILQSLCEVLEANGNEE